MSNAAWFFGLIREGGTYRIVAAGATEGRVRRELAKQSAPTLIVLHEDLASLGVGEREWRRWLPEASAGSTAT